MEPPVPVHPDAPEWFRRALAAPAARGSVEVGGATVSYLAWGEPGDRGLVLVHGGAAHGHWWTHLAPHLAAGLRVVAIDLSGHGHSDHRDRYDPEQWAQEVVEVAAAGGIDGPPVVVGHSMGGFVTIVAAALHGDRIAGAIVCDSPVTEPDPETTASALRGEIRTYASAEEALARFRTVPPQPSYLPYVVDHVARRSLQQVGDGWRWRFDRTLFDQFGGRMRGLALPYLPEVRTRFALLRSEHGLVTEGIGASMYEALGRSAPVILLPEAGHHAMLDQPLVLLTAIRTLLADWDHSTPRRRP